MKVLYSAQMTRADLFLNLNESRKKAVPGTPPRARPWPYNQSTTEALRSWHAHRVGTQGAPRPLRSAIRALDAFAEQRR